MELKQYSVVKLKKINRQFSESDLSFDKRHPEVGDVATIIEIYKTPSLGYELECSNKDGITEWMVTFSPEEVDLEVIDENT